MTAPRHDPVSDIDTTLADLLGIATDEHEKESRKGWISARIVRGTAAFLDESGIIEEWTKWRDADNPNRARRGGRPALIDESVCLIVLLTLARANESFLVTDVAHAIKYRLQTSSRDLLDLPRAEKASEDAVYHRVYRALHRFVAVFDSAPRKFATPTGASEGERTTSEPKRVGACTRLTREEVDEIKGKRDPDEVQRKQNRLVWLTNQILETSVRLVPQSMLAQWRGNICIDATFVGAWGKHGSRSLKKGRDGSQDLMSPEFDAGWYYRDADHRDPSDGTGRKNPKSAWGYEAHLATMVTNDPALVPEFPILILGISLDKPAGRVAENALTAMESVAERGHPAGLFVGDRAYFPNPQPHKLQIPLRKLGYRLAGDYRVDQLGLQAEYAGAILVEGTWYCPSMPRALIRATIDRNSGQIDEATFRQRIEQRARYAFRPKQKPGPDGTTVYMCPGRGPGRTATCSIAGSGPVLLGNPTSPTQIHNPPRHPDVCCTNKSSVTIPADPAQHLKPGRSRHDAAKYKQDIPYQSSEWHKFFGTPRNTIEGFNAYVKDPTKEALEIGGRRRVRGYAFQALLVAVLVMASNIRKIDSFVTMISKPEYKPGAPNVPRERRRNPQGHGPDRTGPPPLVVPA